MTTISEAIILMAGEGSRLRGSDNTFLKPFVPIAWPTVDFVHARCPDPRGDQNGRLRGRL